MKATQYVNWIFKLKSFPLIHSLYPNIKEWTESCGMFKALWILFDGNIKKFNEIKPTVLVIGDGSSPRTGALVAIRSRSEVISVDPSLKVRKIYQEIDRLTVYKNKFEETNLENIERENLVVLLPHSHYKPEKFPEFLNVRNLAVISMPCCVPTIEFMPKGPELAYKDYNVWSPYNIIEIYILKNPDKIWKVKRISS